MLKFMVIVVIAFAKRKKGKEERIARSAFPRIRLPSYRMTGAVN
jgi:hypothetical protein